MALIRPVRHWRRRSGLPSGRAQGVAGPLQTDHEAIADELTVALKAIYAGTKDASGRLLNRGYPVGGEREPPRGASGSLEPVLGARRKGSLMNGFSSGYFANMVFDKADWGPADGTVTGDWSASQKTGEALDAVNTDLSAFKAAGGKLIQYHGWSDAAIP